MTRKIAKPPAVECPPVNRAECDANFRAALAEHIRRDTARACASATYEDDERRLASATRKLERANNALRDEASRAAFAGVAFDQASFAEKLRAAEMDRLAAEGRLVASRSKCEQAEQACFAHRFTFENATVGAANGREVELLGQVTSILAALKRPLSELAGIAKWRAQLIGERFSYDASRFAPVEGRMLAKALIQALPPRIAPPDLTLAAIDEEAAEFAVRLSAELASDETEVSDVI